MKFGRRSCRLRDGRAMLHSGASPMSAESFQIPDHTDDLFGHRGQFTVACSVPSSGHYIFCSATNLEQAVLQVGQLHSGQHNRVFGQTTTLHGSTPLIRSLSARLRAIQPGTSLFTAIRYATATPRAVPATCRSGSGRVALVQDLHGRSP